MNAIGVIGVFLALILVIFLAYRKVNSFITAFAGAIVIIVTNGMNFWDSIIAFMKGGMDFVTSYGFLFIIGGIYGIILASVKTIKGVVAEDALSFAMAVQNMAAKGVCALIISLAGGKIIGLFGIRSFYGVISLMSLAVFLAAVFLLVVFAKKSYRTKTTRSDHT